MLLDYLDQTRADALCTIITIGFMDEQSGLPNDYVRTRFQYDEERAGFMPDDYAEVRQMIHALGIPVRFDKSQPATEFPLILAKNVHAQIDPMLIVSRSYHQVAGLFDELDAACHQLGDEAPNGAYVGGIIYINRQQNSYDYTLVGPTNLTVYRPLWLQKRSDDKVQIFDRIEWEVGKALSVLTSVRDRRARDGENDPVGYDIVEAIEDPWIEDAEHMGKLYGDKNFGCIHGMIVSMLRFPALGDDYLHFEFSMGPNTSKVSSCVPCSLFMTANGRPATSTHLGRGDFWNLPAPSPLYPEMDRQRHQWETDIIRYYNLGIARITPYVQRLPLREFQTAIVAEKYLPVMFLEALTFPGKFTDKIIRTLRPAMMP